ncbi:MAG: hypothetical protein ABR611_15780 [Chthoniobacterales bacterium]
MSATIIYRVLIAIRGCWLLVEWLFGWGAFSHVTTFTLTHAYGTLIADGIAVAISLAILLGMFFFQRWARLAFVVLFAVALLSSPFRVHRYSLSTPPSFVAPVGVFILLSTVAIVAMSFLSPVRHCFTTKQA